MPKLIRYRFKTRAVDDYRPLVDMKDIGMPWWCTGLAGDGSYATIICYLPQEEVLSKYWDDAYDIGMEYREEITYTSRFSEACMVGGLTMPNTKEKGKMIEVLSKHIPYGHATLCLIAEELMAEGVTFATNNTNENISKPQSGDAHKN